MKSYAKKEKKKEASYWYIKTWIDLKGIILKNKSWYQKFKYYMIQLYDMYEITTL